MSAYNEMHFNYSLYGLLGYPLLTTFIESIVRPFHGEMIDSE